MGCYILYSEEVTGSLSAVPNVTAHPSMASVPITVLRYDGPLLCSFNVAIKGLKAFFRFTSTWVGRPLPKGVQRSLWIGNCSCGIFIGRCLSCLLMNGVKALNAFEVTYYFNIVAFVKNELDFNYETKEVSYNLYIIIILNKHL